MGLGELFGYAHRLNPDKPPRILLQLFIDKPVWVSGRGHHPG